MDNEQRALKKRLDEAAEAVELPSFIDNDPVKFVHRFYTPADREIAGFFAATLAWGRRDIVLAKMEELLRRMGGKPAAFVQTYSEARFNTLEGFVHRTFNAHDIAGLTRCLQHAMGKNTTLEPFFKACFLEAGNTNRPFAAVFHDRFLDVEGIDADRLKRHITTPERGSSSKRLWLFMRWMVRRNSAVDAGMWTFMQPSALLIPLDVHVGNVARRLGLLERKTNDYKALMELMETLRRFDPQDPVRYDYALFGLGVLGAENDEET
jgi:uncharacterized protein (TIGR02757 family)